MRKKALMISGALLLAIVFIVVLSYCGAKDKAKISAQEAAQTVLQQYEGEVLETSRSGALYIVKLQTAAGLYEVEVKTDGSGIYGITTLEQFTNGGGNNGQGDGEQGSEEGGQESAPVPETSAQPTASPSPDGSAAPESSTLPEPTSGSNNGKPTATPDKGEKPTTTPTPPPGRPALISEDRAIELALAQVAGTVEDVDLERKGDTRYYLVEIETEDGKEAQVQIQAASGKVMSITWGDDDDNDDDGDADDDDAGDDDNDDQ
ncbi:hypothetical protein J40TS1_23130 [Paenibacillus montaniterrae]|uniref:PepSY domain-containing protein n=1 Tax=Paenibacillus montaniterrae TaxID=429341 RepID=A0A920CX92_9BACL|nr:PepSY domain-containing protein [Paenibacillus montaniterrae]GIP16671.1 hypothetical protein J40TS1_23130 [Paenibacillus montaniterrae]